MNKSTLWSNLTWYRICLRISMLRKNIFVNSKKYKLNLVYKIQSYLINSPEIQALATYQAIIKLSLYYQDIQYINLLNKCNNKMSFLNFIYNKCVKFISGNIATRNYIINNIICLSIEPLLNARFIRKKKKSNMITVIKKFYNNNNVLIRNIVSKLMLHKKLRYLVKRYFHNNYYYKLFSLHYLNFLNCFKNRSKSNKKIIRFIAEDLYNLTTKVLIHDIYWYEFTYIKNKNKNTCDKLITQKNKSNNKKYFVIKNYQLNMNFTKRKERQIPVPFSLTRVENNNNINNKKLKNLFLKRYKSLFDTFTRKNYLKKINTLENQLCIISNIHLCY